MVKHRCVSSVSAFGKRVGVAAAALFGLLVLIAAEAPPVLAAADVTCGASITSCGCVIKKSGFYDIDANLDVSQGTTKAGDCIDIKARHVALDGDFEEIDGAGTGAGIRVFPGASFAAVGVFDCIDGWDVGIEVDANNAALFNFCDENNTSAAVFFKGSKNGTLTDAEPDDTVSGPCVALKNSNGNTLADLDLDDCTDGILLSRSSRNDISFVDADSNSGDGIFMDPVSNNNSVHTNEADDNGGAGIHVGKGSVRNKIVSNYYNSFLGFGGAFGNGTFDLEDDNPDCDNDTWVDNEFSTSSPAPDSVSAVCID
jgi:parallel beta-helix repeat protein